MTADTAIFMQSALNLPQLLDDWNVTTHTPDQWRIFSKLGGEEKALQIILNYNSYTFGVNDFSFAS